MLVELLTSLQLYIINDNFDNTVFISCALLNWILTIVIFIPLHNSIATRPIPHLLARLTSLNWLRTLVWTVAAGNTFVSILSQ